MFRAYQRAGRRRSPRDGLREAFRVARRDLRIAMKAAQEASWKQLVEAVEKDPWGLPYKIVVKKIGGAPGGVKAIGREDAIVRGLFPTTTPPDWDGIPLKAGPEEGTRWGDE